MSTTIVIRAAAHFLVEMRLRLWHIATVSVLQTYVHSDCLTSATFSSDSQRLATYTADGTIRIWDRVTGICFQAFDHNSPSLDDVLRINGLPPLNKFHRRFLMNSGTSRRIQYLHPWIIFHGKKVLWLPLIYRPRKFASSGSIAVIGCYTGQLIFLNFT